MSLQIDYPEIAEGVTPRHRFMSAYEQRIEPPDRRWQYLLMAAEPYETIAFKVVHAGSPSPPACAPGAPSAHACLGRVGEAGGRGRPEAGVPGIKRLSWPGCSGIP